LILFAVGAGRMPLVRWPPCAGYADSWATSTPPQPKHAFGAWRT
jgi:hypothetical protein